MERVLGLPYHDTFTISHVYNFTDGDFSFNQRKG